MGIEAVYHQQFYDRAFELEKRVRELESLMDDLVVACEDATQAMINFGNVTNWPPEMSYEYTSAINKLRIVIAGAQEKSWQR